MMYLLGTLLIFSVLLEGTVTTLPLVLISLLCFTLRKRSDSIFPIAFGAGLLLDLLRVRVLGLSSLFFILFLFLVLLYQRKYEINSYPFVAVSAFLGSLGFLGIFGGENSLMQSLISALLAVILFSGMKKLL